MQVPELTVAFNKRFRQNKTATQIKSTLTNHGFTCGRKVGNPTGKCLIYTSEQVEWLRENVVGRSYVEIASGLNALFNDNKTVEQIKSFIGNHGLNTGRTGCFEKGIVPWNTGTKGVVKPNSGNFKPGTAPPNRKPLWDERICSKDGFILMKVPERDPHTGFPTRYKHKHVWIWEQANGPVPEGMAVSFIDSNKLHCELDNLMLITRSELLSLNLLNYKETPDELKPSVLALAKLQAKAGFRTTGRVPGAGRRKKEAAPCPA
ncbi:MAG: HNH endonuclease signature motif containing protein [Desulfuromonadaceae bacterium]|nr:HNH endonuclease signature motif containing protein [Desulfuromonadaceae bacterium]